MSLLLSEEGPFVRVQIDRPNKANALDRSTLAELAAALRRIGANPHVRLFEITGTGDRAFCAGADLGELPANTQDSAAARAYDAEWDAVSGQLADLACITVARLNGACVGGGLSLALACDLRFAHPHAFLAYPAVRRGIAPSPADVARLTRLIGAPNSKRVLLLGERIEAERARAMGLLDEVADSTALDHLTRTMRTQLETSKQRSLLAVKRMIDSAPISARLADDCYKAVYDQDAEAVKRLGTPRS